MLLAHVNFTYPWRETPVNYWSIPLCSTGVGPGVVGGVIDRCILTFRLVVPTLINIIIVSNIQTVPTLINVA